jgi:hypothetical protein
MREAADGSATHRRRVAIGCGIRDVGYRSEIRKGRVKGNDLRAATKVVAWRSRLYGARKAEHKQQANALRKTVKKT